MSHLDGSRRGSTTSTSCCLALNLAQACTRARTHAHTHIHQNHSFSKSQMHRCIFACSTRLSGWKDKIVAMEGKSTRLKKIQKIQNTKANKGFVLGEPDESKVLRLGVDHPLIQVVEWTPWQLQVIAGQQLLLPVGVVEGRGKWRKSGRNNYCQPLTLIRT